MSALKDFQKAGVLMLLGFGLAVLWWSGIPAGVLGFMAGRWSKSQAAAVDTMRIIEVRRDTIRDTITVREKAVAHYDTVVRNVNDTTIVVQRDTQTITVTVPVEVVQRDQAKDSLLSSYRLDRFQDSLWHIQDAKLPHKPASRYALGVGLGYACNDKGCGPGVSLGLTVRIP